MTPITLYFGGLLAGCSLGQPSSALSCGEGTHQEGDVCVPDSAASSDSQDSPESEDTSDSDDSTGSEDTTGSDDTPPPTKSPKRGLAYNLLDTSDLEAISPGVSWWYNWYFRTDAPEGSEAAHDMQFVPMLWGHNAESDYDALAAWLLEHPQTNDVLVMNEPNLVDQANITPSDAVGHWLRYEQFQDEMREKHSRTIRLIGPAMTWGTMDGYSDPVDWLDAFYAAFNDSEGRDPVIDALAFHWYDYGLDDQLTRLEPYGKTFWVTEMANWHTEDGWTIDTAEKQLETMKEMVGVCESRDDVERYSWFIGRWDPDPHFTSIFEDSPGALSALGEAYIQEPW